MITPTYPAANATFNSSHSTLAVVKYEISHAYEIVLVPAVVTAHRLSGSVRGRGSGSVQRFWFAGWGEALLLDALWRCFVAEGAQGLRAVCWPCGSSRVDTAFACAQGIAAGKGAVSSLFERADFFKMYGNYMQVPPPDTFPRWQGCILSGFNIFDMFEYPNPRDLNRGLCYLKDDAVLRRDAGEVGGWRGTARGE